MMEFRCVSLCTENSQYRVSRLYIYKSTALACFPWDAKFSEHKGFER